YQLSIFPKDTPSLASISGFVSMSNYSTPVDNVYDRISSFPLASDSYFFNSTDQAVFNPGLLFNGDYCEQRYTIITVVSAPFEALRSYEIVVTRIGTGTVLFSIKVNNF